ncbi:MAG: hypothetical protein CMK09_04170 [Ponticaulis sp.]|nr:hypothetical protein [Ponticaulis sp.]|tara:strand:- start:18961 stop:19839 length:879 start_codon:yes stop_codon:yes gene_type:complete
MRLVIFWSLALCLLVACDGAKEKPDPGKSAEASSETQAIAVEADQLIEDSLSATQIDLLERFYQWVETGIRERTAYGAPWQQNIDYLGKLIDEADTAFEQELYNRALREQYGRLIYPFKTQSVIDLYGEHGVVISEADAAAIHPRMGTFIFKADEANTEWLKAELTRRNDEWWTISEFGEDVSRHVWLLTQHADHDRDFQRHVLKLMEPLAATDEILPRNFAYLYDRVAVGEARPQRYGSQLGCYDGVFHTGPLEQPDKVDALRASVGLGPLQVYIDGEFFDQSRAICEAAD